MIDPKNLGIVTAGVVADPEIVADGKVIRYRLAVDYAGQDRDNRDNRTGYFDAVQFVNDDRNSTFALEQIKNGNMKKGSQVQVAYRLQENRFSTDDGNRRSKVELVIEAVTYVGGTRQSGSTEKSETPVTAAAGSIPSF